jgi:hypothetical protein
MKKWLAATLLVAVIAAIGCGEKKTTKPATTPADKGAAEKAMPAPGDAEKKAP